MKVIAIIQARLGSTRLPGKMLLPLLDKPLVQHVIERVQRAKTIKHVVLACPMADYDAFRPMCRTGVFMFPFVGDENDLVERYIHAAMANDADLIVRIPGDNPCVDPAYIDLAVQQYLKRPQVYVSTMYAHVRDRIYVDGVGAEVLSRSRLQWLDQATHGQPAYREHPHLLFQDQHLIDGWEQYQRYANHSETIRLDVNTQEDYVFVKSVYDHFGRNDFTTAEVVAYLDTKKVTA